MDNHIRCAAVVGAVMENKQAPAHFQYTCRQDCITDAKKHLRQYELRGGRKHLMRAIRALKQALEMET